MKNRRQKYIVLIVACMLLCASFFAVPVSAADTNVVTDIIRISDISVDVRNFGLDDFVLDPTDPFAYLNTLSWSELNRPYAAGFNDYDGYDMVDFSFDSSPGVDVVTSFAITESPFTTLQWTSDFYPVYLYLNSGQFYFLSGNLNYVKYTRWSLREYNNGVIGDVIAYTDFVSWKTLTSDVIHVQINRDKFSYFYSPVPRQVVLCFDVVSTPSRDSTFFAYATDYPIEFLQVNSDPNFIGDVSMPYPNIPQYISPDFSGYQDYSAYENHLLSTTEDSRTTFLGMMTNLRDNMVSFTKFFAKLSILLTDITGTIPFLDIVVYISLSLGLFASFLGIAGSLTHAAERSSIAKRKEFESSEKARYEDWLVTHYQRKEK